MFYQLTFSQLSRVDRVGRARSGVRPAPWTKLWALVAMAALLVLPACGPYVIISPYDELTDTGVTALSKRVDGLLDQLATTPVPPYSELQPTYKEIRTDFGVLYARNQLREKNAQTVKQLVALMNQINTLEGLHRDGRIVPVMVAAPSANERDGGPARASLAQTFRAILKLEITKKEIAKFE